MVLLPVPSAGQNNSRQCHALGNRADPVRHFSAIRPQLNAIFSELESGFSLFRPWVLLHFGPVE